MPPSLAANGNSPKVAAYLRNIFPSPFYIKDAKWWIKEGFHKEGAMNRAIDLDGQCIGNIGCHPMKDHPEHIVELGYWIGESHWNKGIISRAISLFTDYVFANTNVKIMTALVAEPNKASMKALEDCGYNCARINKKSLKVRAGVFDEYVYFRSKSHMHSLF